MIDKNTLCSLMLRQGLSTKTLSELAGLPEDTIKNIRYGRVKDAKLITAIKLADALDCSLDELVGREQYNQAEQSLIQTFRKLNSGSQDFVSSICEFEEMLTLEYIDNLPIKQDITVFTPTGYMEDGMIYDSCSFSQLDIRDVIPRYGEDNIQYGFHITSNAFRPVYYKDDILLVAKKAPHPGDVAILLHSFTGRLYIRRYYPGTIIALEPLSQYGKTIYINGTSEHETGEWAIMGVIVSRFRETNITAGNIYEPIAAGF